MGTTIPFSFRIYPFVGTILCVIRHLYANGIATNDAELHNLGFLHLFPRSVFECFRRHIILSLVRRGILVFLIWENVFVFCVAVVFCLLFNLFRT